MVEEVYHVVVSAHTCRALVHRFLDYIPQLLEGLAAVPNSPAVMFDSIAVAAARWSGLVPPIEDSW